MYWHVSATRSQKHNLNVFRRRMSSNSASLSSLSLDVDSSEFPGEFQPHSCSPVSGRPSDPNSEAQEDSVVRKYGELGNDSSSRKRAFVFTVNNFTSEDLLLLARLGESGKCKFLCWGEEIAPTTGTPHLQGFVYFNDAKKRLAVGKLLPRCYYAASRDNPGTGFSSAIAYCLKDGSNCREYGVRPASQEVKGKLSADQWNSMLSSAKNNSFDDIPAQYVIRYYSALKCIAKDFMKRPVDNNHVSGVWVQGPSGCGKSSWVRKLLGENLFYNKMRNKWWDGYRREEYVICDDIDKYDVALGGVVKDWTDRYAFTAEAKGGAMSIRPKLVFFTSQYRIQDIWVDSETQAALLRRCYVIDMFNDSCLMPYSMDSILENLTNRNRR